MKILTQHVFPPIPIRLFDWSAVKDGDCGCPECHAPIGRGRTRLEAILDLWDQVVQRLEAA